MTTGIVLGAMRPDATSFSTGSIPGVGGGVTIHGATSDNSDTTGVKGAADNVYAILGLSNPTALASNERIKAWRVRARVARTAADLGHVQRVQTRLRDSDNVLSEYDEWRTSSSALTEFSGPWRPNAPGRRAWTNTILNRMRLDVAWPPRYGGAVEWLEVRELYVDLDYNTQPTVSAVDITGVTTTTTPTVVFTYGDLENDPQVRTRIKVFRTSDAVAAGFNPETSGLAAWDSGELSGSRMDIVVGKSLISGQEYTAYVKAAQAWAGPEGPYWWSAWVASPSRTVNPTPPAAVSVNLLHLTTLPDYRVLHDITAGSPGAGSSNAIQLQVMEKCFRHRGPFYNWVHPQIGSSGGVVIGADGFYSRQAAFLQSLPIDSVSPAGAAGKTGARMISWLPTVGAFSGLDIGLDNNTTTDEAPPYLWPAIPGLPMRASVWARTRSGTFSTRLHHLSVDATNAVVAGGDQGGSPVPATVLNAAWQRLELAFTPPAGALYGRLSLENVTPTTGVEVLTHGWQVGPDPGAGAALQPGMGKYIPLPPDTPWVDVRSREVLAGLATGQHAYVIDNEVIPGRPVIYRARSVTTVSGSEVAGPWIYYNNYEPAPASTLLRDPYEGENVLRVKRDGRSGESGTEDVSVWHASGRNEDPITLSDWRGGQDGSMTLAWETAVEKKTLEDLVRSTRPLLVQWFDGGASYVRFMSRDWDIRASDWGFFSGSYLETDRP